ncbi:solute carrier family 2, facilitated glucose transporter member 5-like [Erythrolamprus reginae]|uniref:solute carrier family 2, facilitated glucose transporter member 5-like n=1 Tax=Erythrolamprus reginae TaxID=121349 RepID=UPI00396CA83D
MAELKSTWQGVSNYFVRSVLICYAICTHYGFYSWILYSPEVLLVFFYNVSNPNQLIDQATQLSFLKIAIDLFPVGALVGSLLSGYMADRFGRKRSMMIINFLSIISIILFSCDLIICAYELTICAHLLAGICVGINLCLLYIYLFEISPRLIRGGIIMLTNFFVKLGNVIAQILTIPSLIDYRRGWYVVIFLTGIFPVTLIFLLSILPESPRYLLVQKEDEEKAKKGKITLKCTEKKPYDGRDMSGEDLMMGLVWLLYYHNSEILRNAKMDYMSMWVLKIAISLLLCLVALLVTYLVDYLGRRILFLTGLAICTVTLICMVAVLELLRHEIHGDLMSNFSIILLIVFIVAYTLGPNMISIIIALELFLQSSRATAIAIAGFVYCLVNVFLKFIETMLKKELGSYSLLTFTPVCLAVFIYFYKYIPETKNQTLMDIRKMMKIRKSKKIQVKADEAIKEPSVII